MNVFSLVDDGCRNRSSNAFFRAIAPRRSALASLALVAVLVGLAGCAITPQVLTDDENKARVSEDRARLQKEQEAVTQPISLYEAMARALKYNLDFKVELMRKTLAQRQLGLQRYDMLPQFVANLDYNARNNWNGASSLSLLSWRQSLEPSTSSDKAIFSANLGLTWNVLDFGVSYFRAHQAADKVMIREEEKRKVVNRICQEVYTAYWRMVAHERLKHDMSTLAGRVETALKHSRQVLDAKLVEPMAALTYQRELLSIQRELQQLQRNLALSKAQLAALMNLLPGQEFEVVVPERLEWNRDLALPIALMEQIALENRPELRGLTYQKRANANEAKAALVAMLPGIKFGAGYNYNSNSFLFENNWWNIGSQVAWNLMNLVRYPAKKDEIDASNQLLDAERLAMSMAVLTQLHVSLAQYAHALREFGTSDEYDRVQSGIIGQVRAGTKAGSTSEHILIREEMNTLVAKVKRDIAYADLGNAYAAVHASMGLDPIPVDASLEQPVDQLAKTLQTFWETRFSGKRAKETLKKAASGMDARRTERRMRDISNR